MSSTLLRLGLWITILVLSFYVMRETLEESPVRELVQMDLLGKALALGLVLLVGGVVARALEKTTRKIAPKNRCTVCRVPVAPGAIYCREHLRRVLEVEDEKSHMTRTRH
jgi:predicted nucleic acid-binding Zn ribbon protein